MSVTLFQAGIVGGGIVLVGGTATYLAVFHDPAPVATTLPESTTNNTPYGSGKFVYQFPNQFINPDSNEEWWKWAFRQMQKQGISSGQFAVEGKDKKVTKGYGANETSDATALNQVCKKIYKLEKEKIKTNPNPSNSDEYKDEDVWKYCSLAGKKPIIVETTVSKP